MFAAIPFFQLNVYTFHVAGQEIPIDPWATLVCLGFVIGLEFARYRAIKLGLDVRDIVDGSVVTVLTGFFFAHVVTVVFYFPERLTEDGIWAILRVWEGFASTGGFIGAVIGSTVFYKLIRKRDYWRHADVITYGFPMGWFFGRMGCGVVHDHIGKVTTSPIGMYFPEGHYAGPAVRYELGLMEAAYMIPVIALFIYLGRKDRPPGFFLALFSLLYAPLRFVLDFLRAEDLSTSDARYGGLTPAQYGMVAMFFAALGLLYWLNQREFHPWPMDGDPNQKERARVAAESARSTSPEPSEA